MLIPEFHLIVSGHEFLFFSFLQRNYAPLAPKMEGIQKG